MHEKRKGRPIVRGKSTVTKRPANVVYTIEQAFEMFLHAKAAEGLRPRTIADYKAHHKWFTEWLTEYHPDIENITEITPQILRDYIYYLTYEKVQYEGHPVKSDAEKEKKGLSPSTVNIRINTMRAFYRWLHSEGIIPTNPAANIRKQPVEEDRIGAFTDEQVGLLLDMPDQNTYVGFRDYVLMRLLLESGMRINELLSLSIDDIDMKTRLITLPASRNKNRKARVIPISTKMVRLLLELISENKTYFPAARHVFLANYGDPLTESSVADRIKEYGIRAGIADQVRCSPHTFRHTFAKNFLTAGGDIVALQRILGHSSMEMVRKYVQHTVDDLREAHDKFTQARAKRQLR
jgi:integrase/recombinase XerD